MLDDIEESDVHDESDDADAPGVEDRECDTRRCRWCRRRSKWRPLRGRAPAAEGEGADDAAGAVSTSCATVLCTFATVWG